MLSSFTRALAVRELRNKLLLTAALIAIFRVGSQIPAAGISYPALSQCLGMADGNSLISMVSLFSGGALLKLSLLAVGVMPYITAAIGTQMLTPLIPSWKAMKAGGPDGAARINQYTRYGTVALSVVQGAFLAFAVRNGSSALFGSCDLPIMPETGIPATLLLAATFATGGVVVMWIGEQITSRGVGSGPSLLILSAIAARLPSAAQSLVSSQGAAVTLIATLGIVVLVGAVVFVEQAQRRIPVIYPWKSAADGDGGGTYLPLKVNQANVIPVIFAAVLLQAPVMLSRFVGQKGGTFSRFVSEHFASGSGGLYIAVFVILVVFFTFFYILVTYDPAEIADDMRMAGGYIPGVAPGEATANYLGRVSGRLTAAGAAYLSAIGIVPLLILAASRGSAALPFGGTSLLILVGVCMHTAKQVGAQVAQTTYPSLLPTSAQDDYETARRPASPGAQSHVRAGAGRQPRRLGYLRSVVGELRMVSWPSMRQTRTYTAVVCTLLAVAIFSVWGLDIGVGAALRAALL